MNCNLIGSSISTDVFLNPELVALQTVSIAADLQLCVPGRSVLK